MDLKELAQALIDKHIRKTQHIAPVLRSTAQNHYRAGVSDCFNMMLEEAGSAEEAGHPPQIMPLPAEPKSAPLAIQAAHSAIPVPEGKPE